MPITAKSAAEQERQKLFDSIRHFISSKHRVCRHLSHVELLGVLAILNGEGRAS